MLPGLGRGPPGPAPAGRGPPGRCPGRGMPWLGANGLLPGRGPPAGACPGSARTGCCRAAARRGGRRRRRLAGRLGHLGRRAAAAGSTASRLGRRGSGPRSRSGTSAARRPPGAAGTGGATGAAAAATAAGRLGGRRLPRRPARGPELAVAALLRAAGFLARRGRFGRSRRRCGHLGPQPADDGGFDGRGRAADELAHFLELGHDDLALDTELFGKLVDPDLCHVAPVSLWWSGPSRRSGGRGPVSARGCSLLGAHRVLISVVTRFRFRNPTSPPPGLGDGYSSSCRSS